MRTLSRSVVLNGLGSAASLALGFVASVVLARWLGPSDRGLLAVMLSTTTIAYIVTAVGLPISVEYHASRRSASQGALLGNTLLYGAVLGAVTVPAFWLLSDELAGWFAGGRGGDAWLLAGFLIPVNFVAWTAGNQLSGLLRFGIFNALFGVSRLLYALTVLVLLAGLGFGVSGALVATAVAPVTMAAGSLWVILRAARPRLDARVFKSMLSYGARHQLATIFQTLNYRLDVVILSLFATLTDAGHYVVAQVMAEIALMLSAAFSGVLPIVSSEEQEERRAETTTASIRHHGILTAAAIVATAIGGPFVISWGFGTEFHDAILPMLLLLPGIWFLGTGRVVSANLAGRGRPGAAASLAGLATAVTVALDFALIPWLGIYGAVIASVAAYTTFGVAGLLLLSRVSGLSVWTMLVPTRADLAAYPAAAGRLFSGLRRA